MMSTAMTIPNDVPAGSGLRPFAISRACARLIRFVGSTVARYVVWLAGDVARAPHPLARRAWRSRCVRAWAARSLATLGVRMHVRGTAPEPPFLLVSNHLGYLDILVLAALADGCFVARHDLDRWPLIGHLVRAGGTILVERERRADAAAAAATMRSAIGDGTGVILFPEGTSTSGAGVLPFRSSLFEPAIALGQPVHTAALTYRTPAGAPPAENAVCWWGTMPFVPHVWGLLMLPRIDAFVQFGRAPLAGSDRKGLAAAAHDAVLAMHDACAAVEVAS